MEKNERGLIQDEVWEKKNNISNSDNGSVIKKN